MPYINVNNHRKFIEISKAKYEKDFETLWEKVYTEERRLIEENDSIWQNIESEMTGD